MPPTKVCVGRALISMLFITVCKLNSFSDNIHHTKPYLVYSENGNWCVRIQWNKRELIVPQHSICTWCYNNLIIYGRYRIRTCDPLRVKEVRYHCANLPTGPLGLEPRTTELTAPRSTNWAIGQRILLLYQTSPLLSNSEIPHERPMRTQNPSPVYVNNG